MFNAMVISTGEKGVTICATPSSILFCSLELAPGEVKHGNLLQKKIFEYYFIFFLFHFFILYSDI